MDADPRQLLLNAIAELEASTGISKATWPSVEAVVARLTPTVRRWYPEYIDDFREATRPPKWSPIPLSDFAGSKRFEGTPEDTRIAQHAIRRIASHFEGLLNVGPRKAGSTPIVSNAEESADRRIVFVIHGRNEAIRDGMFGFLRSIGLFPLEWPKAVSLTGKASPHIYEILTAAFSKARAIIGLLTPDDIAYLRPELLTDSDEDYERNPTGQARPNVLFELGLAFGHNENRTLIIEIGKLRPFSDIAGMHTVRFNGSPKKRKELISRLKDCGCDVDDSGADWLSVGNFVIDDSRPGTTIRLTDASPTLSTEEITYLLTISRPRNRVSAISTDFADWNPGPESERHIAMIEKYVSFDLMRMNSQGRYRISDLGWRFVDEQWQARILQAIKRASSETKFAIEREIAADPEVTLTDGEEEMKELRRHLRALGTSGLVTIFENGGIDAQLTDAGENALVRYAHTI